MPDIIIYATSERHICFSTCHE